MPTENEKNGCRAYLLDKRDNHLIPLTLAKAPMLTYAADYPAPNFGVDVVTPDLGPSTVSFKVKPRHVSRKQFIRSLQNMGYSGKEAKTIARSIHGSYAWHLFVIQFSGREIVLEHYSGKKANL